MPEGDTIKRAARRVGEALVGKSIASIETPQPRHALDRMPDRLSGQGVRAVDAHGKHLFVRFDGGLTLHSHLRMSGSWRVYRRGEPWRRSAKRAWLVVRTEEHEVVQFDGPVLELMRDGRTRFDQRLAALGPDLLAEHFDERLFLARMRDDDPRRTVGAALLDQRNVAGIGNIWRSEGCFAARIDPWRPLESTGDDELLEIVRELRPRMRVSADGERIDAYVYRRAGRPCRVCATPVAARRQGDDGRTTYWCPACQR